MSSGLDEEKEGKKEIRGEEAGEEEINEKGGNLISLK